MVAALYVATPSAAINFSDSKYVPLAGFGQVANASAASTQARSRDSYTWSRLSVVVTANTLTSNAGVAGYVNGAGGNQSVSISGGATGTFEDTTHSDSIADGDLLNYRVTTGAGTGSVTIQSVSSLVEHSGNVGMHVASHATTPMSVNASTVWSPLHGRLLASTAEDRAQVTCRRATTLSRLRVYVAANAASGTSTVKVRVNGADGNESVSISASSTGEFEDTSNTDSVAVGDEVDLQFAAGGSGAITFALAQTESSDGVMAASCLSTSFSGTTIYGLIGGGTASATDQSTTAKSTQMRLANLFVSASANTRSVATSVALRKNGSSVISLSVPANTTGFFEDTSNEVSVAAASDTLNFSVSSAAGSGSLTVRTVSIEFIPNEVSVTIAGATAGATAGANAGTVAAQVKATISGATATSAAAANAATIAAVQIVSVSGGTATATAAAGAGAVQTFPAAIIIGVTASAQAAANAAAAIAAVRIASVSGERATASAAAAAAAVVIAGTVPGETAVAVASALAAVLDALRIGEPHPVIPGAVARIRRLPAPRVHARRSGDV